MSVSQKEAALNHPSSILGATFDSTTVTRYASLSYLENFKQIIGFDQLLEEGLSYKKYHNSKFSTAQIVDFLCDASVLGFSRFQHMDELRTDNAYLKIKGQVPSEKVCRDLLMNLPDSAASELRMINKRLLSKKAKTEGSRDVVINIDDTVCTVYGDQEGTGVGYNPQKNGRSSFKEKLGILAQTNEVINLTLENGKHHTNFELRNFIRKCRLLLPAPWYLTRVRIDCGGFDINNILYLEEAGLEFVIKCKKYEGIKTILHAVNSREHLYPWTPVDDMFSVNEIHGKLPKWEKTYRFVLVRKPAKSKNPKQVTIEEAQLDYDYQVIVTNIENLSAEEIFHEYNQRCDIENKIDELKEGFSFDQNSQRNKKCNERFLLIKMLAYNLHNWFKSAILPPEFSKSEIKTVRRRFYHLAANICGNGRYRHIRYACDKAIESLITYVIDRLRRFTPILT